MSTIDAHVHLYPRAVNRDPAGWAAAHGEPHWSTMCVRRRRDGTPVQGFPSLDELLRAMDRDGIDRAVLLGWYWNQPASCLLQNRFYADCIAQHPDRLSAFAALHPSMGVQAALEEIEVAREQGLTGIGELSPHSQDCAIDDPVLQEILAVAGRLGMPVNFHVTDPRGRDYPGRVETPLADFLQLARQHPRTRFILSHWGGLLPLVEASAQALGNVSYDTAASPLLYDAGVWSRFVAAAGADKVLFGTDYPLNLYPATNPQPGFAGLVTEAMASGLDRAAITAILGGNARRVPGMVATR